MTVAEPWRLLMLPATHAAIKALPDRVRREVWGELHVLADNPDAAGGEPLLWFAVGYFKLRIGNYRVVYRLVPERRTIYVGRVGHRSRVYSGLEPFGS
jgi:mRNA interferase RelE/StbE